MISNIQITKFRSIEPGVEVKLLPLTLVVGCNNSGKTTFLEAFRLLSVDNLFGFLNFHIRQKADGGRMGHIFSHSENYYYPGTAQISCDIETGSYGTVVDRSGHYLVIKFYRDKKFVCDIILTVNLTAIKFYWPEDGKYRIDGRSIRKSLHSQYAEENFDRLKQALNFQIRIVFHNCSRDDQSLLNEFEIDLINRLHLKRSEFLKKVCEFFDMPELRHIAVRFVDSPLIPRSGEREKARTKVEEINIAIKQVKALRKEIGNRRWLSELLTYTEKIRDQYDYSSKRSNKPGYGGLFYGESLLPASELGSGYRSLLLICLKIEIGELILLDEPETFLHPELQLLLCDYIAHKIKKGKQFIISTHSSVMLNYFFSNPKYGVIETHDTEGKFQARVVGNRHGILQAMDALGVRANQILQTNCIVWIEGPSDRIYLKCWIDIWSGGQLKEGEHYSCVFYGGSLLKHLTADKLDTDSVDRLDLLRINQKAIFIVDSDFSRKDEEIDENKRAVIDSVRNSGGLAIITHGRTIENYIPKPLIEKLCSLLYTDDFRFIETVEIFKSFRNGIGVKKDKVSLANHITQRMSPAHLLSNKPLRDLVREICTKIYEWNGIKASSFSEINPIVVQPEGEDLASRIARLNNLQLIREVRRFTGLTISDVREIVKWLRRFGLDTSNKTMTKVLEEAGIEPSDKLCDEIRKAIGAGIQNISGSSPAGTHML